MYDAWWVGFRSVDECLLLDRLLIYPIGGEQMVRGWNEGKRDVLISEQGRPLALTVQLPVT